MILQALASYYESLAARREISRPGWCSAKVSFALALDGQGRLQDVVPLYEDRLQGKKTLRLPRIFPVPERVNRSSGIAANFLCENASYFLGIDAKGKPQRSLECFQAAAKLHRELLGGLESPAARAVCAYFESWEPAEAEGNPVLAPYLKEILMGANMVFRVEGRYAHEELEIIARWDARREAPEEGAQLGVCAVTGARGTLARLHPKIQGVRGAQSSGASLVSYNAPAFCSFGKEQSYNSSVGEGAAFAYATALNHLLSQREHVKLMGDTTLVYWAENGERGYADMFNMALEPTELDEGDWKAAVTKLSQGLPYDFRGRVLAPDTRFYLLGLSPNAARISVRFFCVNRVGELFANINKHYGRLAIVRPAKDTQEYLPIWRLLAETVNPNARDKAASPLLAGAVLRAIVQDSPYPALLFQSVMLRIRAERKVNRGRAAIIKACLIQRNYLPKEEVLTVKLDEQSSYAPYVLGRLFAILEWVQETASPGINATIKDRCFNSACATPASIFPQLLKLKNSHIRVISRDKPGMAVNFEKDIGALLKRLQEPLPAHLSLEDQGTFILGYYHQTQQRYTKKEDK